MHGVLDHSRGVEDLRFWGFEDSAYGQRLAMMTAHLWCMCKSKLLVRIMALGEAGWVEVEDG